MASELFFGFLSKEINLSSVSEAQQRRGAAVLPPQTQASWNGSNTFRSCDTLLCSLAIFQPKQDANEISP